jgi:hypothetical protein
MTNLTATIQNVADLSTLTINGVALTVVNGGAGKAVIECRGARGGTVLLVQNAKSGRWFMIRNRVETLITAAA